METSSQSHGVQSDQRQESGDEPRISLTLFGRSGTTRIKGTLERLQSSGTRGILSGPAAWLALVLVGSLTLLILQSILSGDSAATSAVLIAGCALVALSILALDQLWGARRTASIEDEFDCTHIVRGTLVGTGKVREAARNVLNAPPVLSLYANDDDVLVIVEGEAGQRTAFVVDALDLTATSSGRYVDCAFSVDGTEYSLRSVKGRLSTDPGRYQ